MSTKRILKVIRHAYDQAEWAGYAEAVISLARIQPRDFAATLDRERLLPRDASPEIFKYLRERVTDVAANQVLVIFDDLSSIDERLNAVRRRAGTLKVWRRPFATIFQFAAQIEKQGNAIHDLSLERLPEKAAFPQVLLGDWLPIGDGSMASPEAAHEELAEAFQLVLAHVQATFAGGLNDVPKREDATDKSSLMELVALAQIWRAFEDLRQQVIYMGWRSGRTEDGDLLFSPIDWAEFQRIEVGRHRRIDQLTTAAAIFMSRHTPRNHDASDLVVKSLQPPEPHESWDGNINRVALARMASEDAFADAFDANSVALFYKPIADELVFGPREIPWHIISRIWRGVRAIATSLSEKLKKLGSAPRPVLVEAKVLIDVLSEACGVTAERTSEVLDVLTFDRSQRELEIWDTPLVRAPEGRLLVIPQLILNGSPLRRLENFATACDPNLFDRRGNALEEFVAQVFMQQEIPVQSRLRFGSKKTECDAVVWWNGWLILLEEKCTKSIFSAYDAHRGRKAIEDAAGQLVARRNAILGNWDAFRAAANRLPLPSTVVPPESVVLVAVTNIPHFTGQRIGDVVVTDDFCLHRFFGDPSITLVKGVEPVGNLGIVRPIGEVSPEMFFEYLAAPFQMRAGEAALVVLQRWLPAVDEQTPVAVVRTTYRSPLADIARNMLGRLDASNETDPSV